MVKSGLARYKARKRLGLLSRGPVISYKKLPMLKRMRGTYRKSGFYGRFNGPRAENKFLDTALNFQVDQTAEVPATGQLCLIPQGDGQSEREGRKCTINSILIKGILTFVPGAAAVASDVAYIYVVQDTQTNGAAATVANDNTGIFTAAGANLAVAVRCLANTERFKILHRFKVPLVADAGVTTAYNNVSKHIEWYKKCSIPMEYDAAATTGALTTIRSNNVFLVAGSVNSDDTIAFVGVSRVRFLG